MTHHEFENALRSVKYTPEQRTAMREKLKNTMISGDRMPESDEPFAYTIENAFVEENEKMKITKKTVIGTIAACLIVGITGGVFAKLIINKNNNLVGDSVVDPTAAMSYPEVVPASLDLHPTGAEDTCQNYLTNMMMRDMGRFIVTENGYYCFKENLETNRRGIAYAPRGTGESVYLCTRPQCLHDGNEYCVATNSKYWLLDVAYYEGALYAIANDRSDAKVGEMNSSLVLLRYAPDGSSMEVVKQLETEILQCVHATMCIHRGTIWISTEYRDYIGDVINGGDVENYTRSALYCYEIASGKTAAVLDSGWTTAGWLAISDFIGGSGDFVYFTRPQSSWMDTFTEAGIFRINCYTGQITQLADLMVGCDEAVFHDGKIAYTIWKTASNGESEGYDLFRLDVATGETKQIKHCNLGELTWADDYLIYRANQKWYVMDWDGNAVKELYPPKGKHAPNPDPDCYDLTMIGDEIYVRDAGDEVWYTTFEELFENGSTDNWQKAYGVYFGTPPKEQVYDEFGRPIG